MQSGPPEPHDELRLIIDSKRHAPASTVEVVSRSAGWLKGALAGAGVAFSYATCEDDHYGYAVFTVMRSHGGEPVSLDIKIAEVRDRPFVFAEVRSFGRHQGTMFPFFGDLGTDDARELLLHYVADFIISTEPIES